MVFFLLLASVNVGRIYKKNVENVRNENDSEMTELITARGNYKVLFFFFQESKLYELTVHLACSHLNFSVYVY